MSYGIAESRESWDACLAAYRQEALAKSGLRVAWLREVFRLFGAEIEEGKLHQVDPLFANGWSPMDAAQHLRVVWVLKRWPLPPMPENLLRHLEAAGQLQNYDRRVVSGSE